MEVYILAIGNEILEGSILDTNSNFIAKELSKLGITCSGIFAVGDDKNKLKELIKELTKKEAIIITTGGLGPTFDDITTEAISLACNKRLKMNRKIYFDTLNKVQAKGVRLKLSHLRQAYLPESSQVIPNQYGTAVGIYLKCNSSHIIAMPGVPSEMKPMFKNHAIGIISKIVQPETFYSYDLKLIGVAESDADKFLKSIDTKNALVILNAMEGELAVRIRSKQKEALENIKNAFIEEFGLKVYSLHDKTIEYVLSNLLDKLGFKIAFVESITAGYLTQLMYDYDCFLGSITTKSEVSLSLFENAQILACPCNLSGNEFELKLRVQDKSISTTLRYLGNINFMRKSVAKRTLGLIYEYLKTHFD